MKKLIFYVLLIVNLVYCMEQVDSTTNSPSNQKPHVILSCSISDIPPKGRAYSHYQPYYYRIAHVDFDSSPNLEIKPFNLKLCAQPYCAHDYIPPEKPFRIACNCFKYTMVNGCASEPSTANTINLVFIYNGCYRIVFKLNFEKSAQDCCMLLCTVLDGLQVFCESLQNCFEGFCQSQHTIVEKIGIILQRHPDLTNEIFKIFELGYNLHEHIKGTSDRFKTMYGLSFNSCGIYPECEETRGLYHVDYLTINRKPTFGLYLDLDDLAQSDNMSGCFACSQECYYYT